MNFKINPAGIISIVFIGYIIFYLTELVGEKPSIREAYTVNDSIKVFLLVFGSWYLGFRSEFNNSK